MPKSLDHDVLQGKSKLNPGNRYAAANRYAQAPDYEIKAEEGQTYPTNQATIRVLAYASKSCMFQKV
jgi:hypothetical protein